MESDEQRGETYRRMKAMRLAYRAGDPAGVKAALGRAPGSQRLSRRSRRGGLGATPTGASARTLARYRRKVSANRRRLSRPDAL